MYSTERLHLATTIKKANASKSYTVFGSIVVRYILSAPPCTYLTIPIWVRRYETCLPMAAARDLHNLTRMQTQKITSKVGKVAAPVKLNK